MGNHQNVYSFPGAQTVRVHIDPFQNLYNKRALWLISQEEFKVGLQRYSMQSRNTWKKVAPRKLATVTVLKKGPELSSKNSSAAQLASMQSDTHTKGFIQIAYSFLKKFTK